MANAERRNRGNRTGEREDVEMAVEKLGRGRGGGRAEKRGRSTFGLAAGGGRRTRDIARG